MSGTVEWKRFIFEMVDIDNDRTCLIFGCVSSTTRKSYLKVFLQAYHVIYDSFQRICNCKVNVYIRYFDSCFEVFDKLLQSSIITFPQN